MAANGSSMMSRYSCSRPISSREAIASPRSAVSRRVASSQISTPVASSTEAETICRVSKVTCSSSTSWVTSSPPPNTVASNAAAVRPRRAHNTPRPIATAAAATAARPPVQKESNRTRRSPNRLNSSCSTTPPNTDSASNSASGHEVRDQALARSSTSVGTPRATEPGANRSTASPAAATSSR